MTRAALPFSHFTKGPQGVLLNLADCELCGEKCQAANAIRRGTNTPVKLRRLGLVELVVLPPELSWSETVNCAVCPTCHDTAEVSTDPEGRQAGQRARFDGSTAVATLESVWRVIQGHNPDAPRVVFLLGAGSDKPGVKVFGHWWAGRWRVEDGERIGEIMISGERLGMGAEWVLSTLLHECAHALAFVREIKDTSRGGRYHNRRFADLALETGLVCEKDSYGYNKTSLTEGARDLYETELQALAQLCARGHRIDRHDAPRIPRPNNPADPESGEDDTGAGAESKANGKRVTLACGCAKPRKIRIVHSVAELGLISCNVCAQPFTA